MKHAQIFAMTLLASGALLLSACAHKQTAAEAALAAQANYKTSAANAGAKAYAIAKAVDYKKDSSGFRVNPMSAPANQVYYFGFDQSSLRSQDMKALAVQANYLATHGKARVRLEGNTDNRGSREYNVALGWRRDQTVARILEQAGVRPSQIDMVSYGKENPVAYGNNAQSWALNRRVVMIYSNK